MPLPHHDNRFYDQTYPTSAAIMGVKIIFRNLAVASALALNLVDAATLTVSTSNGNASSPLLYGLMFEVSH